ncbi:hypothetical protein [Kocuria palustris]|uniref:hypothetical protein n=1 Tax=Kocuria palustris TaxID=71999 RepID=UPI0023017D7C|nr:hypothetical protein [Kocuria palustris]
MNGEWDEQGRRRGRSSVDQASVPVSATIAIVSGMLAGVVGTAVHGNIARFGDGVWIPWGAPLALALLLSLSVWSGTTTRRIWAAAVPGIVAYAAAFALAFGRQDSPLVVLSTTSAIGLAGLLWFGGILVVTLLSVVLVGRWWRRRRAEVRRVLAEQAAEAFDAEPLVSPEDVSGAVDAAPGVGPRGRA